MSSLSEVEILLVEDNMSDAELTLRALRKENLTNNIVHVTDGEEALDFLYNRNAFSDRHPDWKPKIVILDLKLPKVDGLEVLKVIKSDPRLNRMPVVILTSSSEEPDLQESYRLGVNSYIVKPVEFDKFVEAVRTLGLYWSLLNQLPNGD
ncbi:MAG: response regulator [Firmicutes bacterium]|nr:response regulator [Bacillota bacterium]